MNILLPKRLNFGADIKHIEFYKETIIKIFKSQDPYYKTLLFYHYITNDDEADLFPKLYSSSHDEFKIETENCGELLNLYNLPPNWVSQINALRDFFLHKQILIQDIRFMPHTPYVINNLCIKNEQIFLVDLTMYSVKNKAEINHYFDDLIYTMRFYYRFRDNCLLLFFIHIVFKIKWYFFDLVEKILHSI